MKKTLSQILTLALLITLLAPALAESPDYVRYTHPTDGFQISYPADWFMLDKENFDGALRAIKESGNTAVDASAMEALKETIQAVDMFVCVSPDNAFNFNLYALPLDGPVTGEDILSELCPMGLDELRSIYGEIEVNAEGVELAIGDLTYYAIAATAQPGGETVAIVQMYYPVDTQVYIFTYTIFMDRAADLDLVDAQSDAIASSFVPGA